MSYGLGVDLGTTYTAAAISTADGVRIVQLQHDRYAVPSVVAPAGDDAQTTIGRDAQQLASMNTTRAAREFKRRFGDEIPMLVNGEPWMPEQLTALLLDGVYARVTRELGATPNHLVLTHPATWGEHRLGLLRDVVAASIDVPITLVPEPVAAAIHFHDRCRSESRTIPPGSRIAVYDLGGGTFDTAVLGLEDVGYQILGEPEGLAQLGGLDLDQVIFDLVYERAADIIDAVDQSSSDRASLIRLREECTLAKETLSVVDRVEIPVALTTGSKLVVVERTDFESRIEFMIEQTVDLIERTIGSTGADDVDSVLLVGGSSRVPLVGQMLSERLGLQVRLDSHPKQAIALGAALSTTPIDYTVQTPAGPPTLPEAPPDTGPTIEPPQANPTCEPTNPVEFTVQASDLRNILRQRYFVVLTGASAGESQALDDEWITIGRSSKADLTLSDPAISGVHAEARLIDGVVEFRDLGSTNGTWLDGKKVTNGQDRSAVGAMLSAGSVIELGSTLLLVEAPMESVHDPSQLRSSWKSPEPADSGWRPMSAFSKKPDKAYADLLERRRDVLEGLVAETRAASRLTVPSGPRLAAFAVHAQERVHEEFPGSPNYGWVTLGYGARPTAINFRPSKRLRKSEMVTLNAFAGPYLTDPWMPLSVKVLGNTITLVLDAHRASLLARAVLRDFSLRHPNVKLVALGVDLSMREWRSVAALGVKQGVEGAAVQDGLLISLGHSRTMNSPLVDHVSEQGSEGTVTLLPAGSKLGEDKATFIATNDEMLSGIVDGVPTQFIPVGLADR